MTRSCCSVLALPLVFFPLHATSPKFEPIAPVLFEIEHNVRYASTDLKRWEVFTRQGVDLGNSLRLDFIGVDQKMRLEGNSLASAKLSIYKGNDRAQWKPECLSYEAVAYRGMYPGVDLVYRRLEGRLKGDFIVQPGVDPAVIRFRFHGLQLRVKTNGDRLSVRTSSETLEERIPLVYEGEKSGEQGRVRARYKSYADGSIGFAVEGHDPAQRLVIDPDLIFSSFLAGTMLDQVTATVFSNAENLVLVTGWTESSDLYGAQASSYKAGIDGYYGRFNIATNGSLVLNTMTLFGGSGTDKPLAIAVSAGGAIAIAGTTSSPNFPTLLPYQTSLKGSSDGFLMRFSPFSTTMASSTYMGGTGTEQINGVAIDNSGTLYFAGTTSSKILPVTTNAIQPAFQGGATDCFVGTLNANSTPALGYLTYLGGSASDSVGGLALLNSEVYLTGATDSLDYPVNNAVFSTSGGGQDAFVTKLTSTGFLSYSTFLGGNGGYPGSPEMGTAIAVNSSGEAYVTGMTSSTNFPVLNAAQAQPNFRFGVTDAFLAHFSASGGLVFSTYWGGSSWDQGNAISILPSGYVVIAGTTSSLDFPLQGQIGAGPGPTGPYDGSSYAGSYDAFVAVFAPGGTIYWSTYLGGAGADSATAVAAMPRGEIFVGGSTGSYNFPKLNAFQTTISSTGYHGFMARIGLQRAQVGHLRASTGQFILVKNADFLPFVPISKYTVMDWSNVCPPGTANTEAIPVVGDWDNTGRPRLGIFRKSTGTWYLDMNGDDLFTFGVDRVVTGFGAGAYPVVGDWDNTGRVRLGYFQDGLWFLDINGDNAFTYAADWVKAFGVSGDIPIVGDWTNTAKSRLGVFRGGLWYLDIRGDFTDQGISAIAGAATDNPVFGDWDNSGIRRIGNYRTVGYPIGYWFLDINGNFSYDGAPADAYYVDGGTGDTAVVGIRSH